MNKFSPKKPRDSRAAVRRQPRSPKDTDFVPFFLGAAALAILVSFSTPPGAAVGDIVSYDGTATAASAGSFNAAIVQDAWGDGARPCSLNLRHMQRAGGITRVEALNREHVVLQWLAPKAAPPVGCPGAPALLAVSASDYRLLVAWRQTASGSAVR